MIATNRCQRCGKKVIARIMSMYDTKMICIDCSDKESKRNDYKKAVEADVNAIKNGNYNFKGIGGI